MIISCVIAYLHREDRLLTSVSSTASRIGSMMAVGWGQYAIADVQYH